MSESSGLPAPRRRPGYAYLVAPHPQSRIYGWHRDHVLSHATPYVMRDTAAVHILTNKPLTASHGKKTVAKELMLWEGADCYYCVGDVDGARGSRSPTHCAPA